MNDIAPGMFLLVLPTTFGIKELVTIAESSGNKLDEIDIKRYGLFLVVRLTRNGRDYIVSYVTGNQYATCELPDKYDEYMILSGFDPYCSIISIIRPDNPKALDQAFTLISAHK